MVNIGMGNKTKEGLVLMTFDKFHGLVRDRLGEKRLIGTVGDIGYRFILFNNRKWLVGPAIGHRISTLITRPHVIRVRNPEVLVEALGQREEGFCATPT